MTLRQAGPRAATRRRAAAIHGAIAALAFLLAACGTERAPAYDDYIDSGLTQLSQTIETYYAAMPATGYARDTYPAQEPFYAETIGKIEALKSRAAARPVPDSAVTRWLGMEQNAAGAPGIGGNIPSVTNLSVVSDALAELRDRQRERGLSPAFVGRSVEQMRIALRKAITYELALKQ